jgi:transcriptional regulator with XRE-family HTH domain
MATGSSSRPSNAGAQGSRPEGWAAQFNALGGFIRSQRQMAKLSLREMASMTKVSNAYLSQVERGLHQPSIRVLRAVADALEVSGDQLLAQAGLAPTVASGGSDDGTDDDARPTAVERAIGHDRRLDEEARRSLLVLYRRMADLPDRSGA